MAIGPAWAAPRAEDNRLAVADLRPIDDINPETGGAGKDDGKGAAAWRWRHPTQRRTPLGKGGHVRMSGVAVIVAFDGEVGSDPMYVVCIFQLP